MVNEKIIQLIRQRFKVDIVYPQQCEVLSMAIEDATGKSLSTTTLKRMLGFVRGVDTPRLSSLDILAQYLGYNNYSELARAIGEYGTSSEFRHVKKVMSEELTEGDQIQITYQPDRMLRLSYMGNNKYLVNESRGSKLLKGDQLLITAFYVGFDLVVSDVERAGEHLGSYVAAKQGGISTIRILQ